MSEHPKGERSHPQEAPMRKQLLTWAAGLVRAVCSAELARNIDQDVAEPVRVIALQMRDAAYSATPPTPPAVAREEPMALNSHEIAYENDRLRAENERLRAELSALRAALSGVIAQLAQGVDSGDWVLIWDALATLKRLQGEKS